jgi:hypothetical protein
MYNKYFARWQRSWRLSNHTRALFGGRARREKVVADIFQRHRTKFA